MKRIAYFEGRRILVLCTAMLIMLGPYAVYAQLTMTKTDIARELTDNGTFKSPNDFEPWYNMMYSVYNLPNVILPVLMGILTDSYGVQLTLYVLGTTMILGHFLFIFGLFHGNMYLSLLGRFFFGGGSESLGNAQTVVLTRWSPPSFLGFFINISSSVAGAGTVIGDIGSRPLARQLGLEASMWVGSILLILCVFAAFIGGRFNPSHDPALMAEFEEDEVNAVLEFATEQQQQINKNSRRNISHLSNQILVTVDDRNAENFTRGENEGYRSLVENETLEEEEFFNRNNMYYNDQFNSYNGANTTENIAISSPEDDEQDANDEASSTPHSPFCSSKLIACAHTSKKCIDQILPQEKSNLDIKSEDEDCINLTSSNTSLNRSSPHEQREDNLKNIQHKLNRHKKILYAVRQNRSDHHHRHARVYPQKHQKSIFNHTNILSHNNRNHRKFDLKQLHWVRNQNMKFEEDGEIQQTNHNHSDQVLDSESWCMKSYRNNLLNDLDKDKKHDDDLLGARPLSNIINSINSINNINNNGNNSNEDNINSSHRNGRLRKLVLPFINTLKSNNAANESNILMNSNDFLVSPSTTTIASQQPQTQLLPNNRKNNQGGYQDEEQFITNNHLPTESTTSLPGLGLGHIQRRHSFSILASSSSFSFFNNSNNQNINNNQSNKGLYHSNHNNRVHNGRRNELKALPRSASSFQLNHNSNYSYMKKLSKSASLVGIGNVSANESAEMNNSLSLLTSAQYFKQALYLSSSNNNNNFNANILKKMQNNNASNIVNNQLNLMDNSGGVGATESNTIVVDDAVSSAKKAYLINTFNTNISKAQSFNNNTSAPQPSAAPFKPPLHPFTPNARLNPSSHFSPQPQLGNLDEDEPLFTSLEPPPLSSPSPAVSVWASLRVSLYSFSPIFWIATLLLTLQSAATMGFDFLAVEIFAVEYSKSLPSGIGGSILLDNDLLEDSSLLDDASIDLGVHLQAVLATGCVFLPPLLSLLTDRTPRLWELIMAASLLANGVLYLFLSSFPPQFAAWALALTFCLFQAVIWPCIAASVPEETQGLAYGITAVVSNVGTGIVPVVVTPLRMNKGFKQGLWGCQVFLAAILIVGGILALSAYFANEYVLYIEKHHRQQQLQLHQQIINNSYLINANAINNNTNINNSLNTPLLLSYQNNHDASSNTNNQINNNMELHVPPPPPPLDSSSLCFGLRKPRKGVSSVCSSTAKRIAAMDVLIDRGLDPQWVQDSLLTSRMMSVYGGGGFSVIGGGGGGVGAQQLSVRTLGVTTVMSQPFQLGNGQASMGNHSMNNIVIPVSSNGNNQNVVMNPTTPSHMQMNATPISILNTKSSQLQNNQSTSQHEISSDVQIFKNTPPNEEYSLNRELKQETGAEVESVSSLLFSPSSSSSVDLDEIHDQALANAISRMNRKIQPAVDENHRFD